MEKELKKSLVDLIDETLNEIEELKKSRYVASEIELKGPGEDLAGKPTNGKLDASKAEDDEDEDEDKDEAEKAEGVNHSSDTDAGKHKMDKAEACMDKAEDKKDKKDDKKDDEDVEGSKAHEAEEKKMAKKLLDMHKSQEEANTLMKSFVESRIAPLESQLASIFELVKKMSDQPVAAKGVSYKGVAPLMKSNEVGETLSKSEVASKLFELKKSGSKVDSSDIARAEMGHDLEKIIQKYQIS